MIRRGYSTVDTIFRYYQRVEEFLMTNLLRLVAVRTCLTVFAQRFRFDSILMQKTVDSLILYFNQKSFFVGSI